MSTFFEEITKILSKTASFFVRHQVSKASTAYCFTAISILQENKNSESIIPSNN